MGAHPSGPAPRRRRAGAAAVAAVVAVVCASLAALALPLVAAAAVPAGGPPAPTGPVNTWVPTASMHAARTGQTATLLPDGKVLVAGGGSAAAELYDPGTGRWSPTGAMHEPRSDATATLLPDGEVLVAGGCCNAKGNAWGSAELYHPATGTWTLTGSMSVGRMGHTATALPGGNVLVAGGLSCPSGCGTSTFYDSLRSAELYHPATGTWTRTAPMDTSRQAQTATLLPDGEVLVAGGFFGCDDDFCTDDRSAELYDPASGTWHDTGSMHVAREQLSATALPDGEVLVAGGLNYRNSMGPPVSYDTAELYDPATGTFTLTPPMAAVHVGQTATLLRNGWVLVAGGGTAVAELYEPGRNVWVSPGALLTARTDFTATALPDGTVLAAGGDGPDGEPLASAERYLAGAGPLALVTPTSVSFSTVRVGARGPAATVTVTNEGNAPLTVSGVAVVGADPSDFTAGGSCAGAPVPAGDACSVAVTFAPVVAGLRQGALSVLDDAPRQPQQVPLAGYGAGPDSWSTTGSMRGARQAFASALLADGDVLVAGGGAAPLVPSADAELWDPRTGTWSETGPLPVATSYDTAVALSYDAVLAVGGYGEEGLLDDAELYDPTTHEWIATTPMHAAGYDLTATLLNDGDVLVTGPGLGADGEVFDPTTTTWTDTGPMAVVGFGASAVLLGDGDVLVVGGGTAVGQLYDPATNDWTETTGSLPMAIQEQAATLLPDGDVLVAGGEEAGGDYTPQAGTELYDPATETFTAAQPMLVPRVGARATVLADGVVMVAGGCCGTGPGTRGLATTELYDPDFGYWYYGPPMTMARQDFALVTLADGSVLAAGGAPDAERSTATAEVLDVPAIGLSPSDGPPGQSVTVRGAGFDAGETVAVEWDTGPRALGSATASVTGTVVVKVSVPTGAKPGTHTLTAVGRRSNGSATATFHVLAVP